jgi:Peptidoglycan-synthase activator LpoB
MATWEGCAKEGSLMLPVRPIWLGVAAVLAVAAPAADAADVKLSGKLGGTKLPKASAGVSVFKAMNLSDGTFAGAQYLSRRGAFYVKVPPGPYGLLAGSVFLKKKNPTTRLVAALLARSGKSRRLPLSLRRSAADPIVGVNYFTGGPAYQNRGFPDMIETDLIMQRGSPCNFKVVALKQRAEVLKELRLQQTKYFDPKTRVKTGQLLNPTVTVNGSIVSHGEGDVSYSIQVVNAKTGKVKGTISGRTTTDNYLSISRDLAKQLAKIICQPDDVYFRITGYTVSEKSSTSHGEHTTSHTLSAPGPVGTMFPCTDPASPTCPKVISLEAPITSTFTGHVTGTPTPIICPGGAWDYGTSTINQTTRQTISFDPDKDDPATTGAGTIPGVGDVVEDKCGAHDFADSQGFSASVPAADFLSGDPVTFGFSGQGTAPSQGDHPGITITWSFSETITVQRVNADGSHI